MGLLLGLVLGLSLGSGSASWAQTAEPTEPGQGLSALLETIMETTGTAATGSASALEPDQTNAAAARAGSAQGSVRGSAQNSDAGSDAGSAAGSAESATVAFDEEALFPPTPRSLPQPDKSYDALQAVVREQRLLVRFGTRPRPVAPLRDGTNAVIAPVPRALQETEDVQASSDRAAPILGPEGEPFPYPLRRSGSGSVPVHRILSDGDDSEGTLTVYADGSRAVVASNTRRPNGQEVPTIDRNCPARLRALGVQFSPLPDFRKESGCQSIGALDVTYFGSGVSANPNVHVTCEVAEGMALWLRNAVQTETARYFGSRVVKLSNTHGYSCRFRSGGRVSEHGFANAIDIGTFHLADGRQISVLDHWYGDGSAFGNNAARWFNRINDRACDYFQLVLNPRSNKAHANHFHLDQGPWKSCD